MTPSPDAVSRPGTMRATWLSRRRLFLPPGGRLPGGLWMHAACRPLTVAANTWAGHLVRVSSKMVPARRVRLNLPFPDDILGELVDRVPQLRSGDWVVMFPGDARRARVMILGLGEGLRPATFVRATLDEPNRHGLDLVDALRRRASDLVLPIVDDVFELGEWWITVEEPLPQAAHRPARLDAAKVHELTKTIQSLTPPRDGLMCGHGDLGPWNLRRYSDGRIGILDWEYATWCPAATDGVWYATTLRLATSRQQGPAIGRVVAEELQRVYPQEEIARAAAFIIAQRGRPEPSEVREGVGRSDSLRQFERRLEAALGVLTD